MISPALNIRPMDVEDHAFVFNSWMNSYRKGSKLAKSLDYPVYKAGQTDQITRLLLGSDTLIAANPEEPGQIFGYICFTEFEDLTALHWIYVKEPFRRFGIADAMIEAMKAGNNHAETSSIFATHTTHNWRWIAEKWGLRHNPYLINEVKYEDRRDRSPLFA